MTDGSVSVLWFGFVVWFLRKLRPTQLWVELSWVVAILFYTNGSKIQNYKLLFIKATILTNFTRKYISVLHQSV